MPAGIMLPMDISDIKIADFDIMHFNKEEVINTLFFFYLPATHNDYWTEKTSFVYDGYNITLQNLLIDKPENDPYLTILQTMNIGINIKGLETLSLIYLSDHNGQYPIWATRVFIQGNICNWNIPYKKPDEILGSTPSMDKVFVLKIWAEAARKNNNSKHLTYEDVSLFFIHYIYPNGIEKGFMVNALTYNTAYRQKVREYLLDQYILEKIEQLEIEKPKPQITNEADLFAFADSRINDVFSFHIENRRWVEAFWDGKRKMTFNKNIVQIPAEPKSETRIQPTIHVLLYEIFNNYGIQVIRESDEGIGNLDFRLLFTNTQGMALSIAIEFKLAHHKRLLHGLQSQLPAYMNAIRTTHGLYLILWFKDKAARFFKEPSSFSIEETKLTLTKKANEINNRLNKVIKVLIFDASIRKSASVELEDSY